MILQILNRFRRTPMAALSVVLLAGVLSASLCGLHAANIAEQARYDETVENVEVQLIVTNLSATRYNDLDMPKWVLNVFTRSVTVDNLMDYVKDVQVGATQEILAAQLNGDPIEAAYLVGISGPELTTAFAQGKNSLITWFDGYEESVLKTDAKVCLIPESLLPEGADETEELTIHMKFRFYYETTMQEFTTERDLIVAGVHRGPSDSIYCPYDVVRGVYEELNKAFFTNFNSIRATLKDNSKIDEVREASKAWFAEPNATGEKTPWDYAYYFHYPYALLIDDSKLVQAETTLKISILINELCAVLVFALSAGASFFVGFLMIRSRKREIALMRTLGTRTVSIFFNFALEQIVCLLAGTALGGWLFDFRPPERLCLFIGVYAVGLCLALTVFLRKNLMTTIKEEE